MDPREVKFANESNYIGEFKNSVMHGKGVLTWPSGESYKGEFVNGKREGYGEYCYGNGMVYKGQWVNDKEHGKAIIEQGKVCEVMEFANGKAI